MWMMVYGFKGSMSMRDLKETQERLENAGSLLIPKIPGEGYKLNSFHRFSHDRENDTLELSFRSGHVHFQHIRLKVRDIEAMTQEWVDENITPDMFTYELLNTDPIIDG